MAFIFPFQSFSAGNIIDVLSDSSARYVVISNSKSGSMAEAKIMITRSDNVTYETVKYDCEKFTIAYGNEHADRPIIPESPDYFIANSICQNN